MSKVRTVHAVVIGAMITVSLQIAPLTAQKTPRIKGSTDSIGPGTMTRTMLADNLRDKAQFFFSKRSTWAEGARVLQQAAELREPSDPAYVWDMFDAARAFLNAGKLANALETMAATGSRGIEVGDVRKAAHAYLNAAVIARRLGGHEEEARGYIGTALELAWHPKTVEFDRVDILARIKEGGRKIVGEPDWIP